jgi:peptide deformylase
MHEKENIVQYYDLKPAEAVDRPEEIPLETLHKWWSEANRICISNNFTAVAFNQLSRATLDKLGFDGKNPNIIFLGKNPDVRDEISKQLLINPSIQVSPILGDILGIEGCGSITDSEGIMPRMFITRPRLINAETFFWKPGDKKPIGKEFIPREISSFLIQHEYKHLEGKTALSEAEKIINFTDRTTMVEVIEEFLNPKKYNLSKVISQFDRWIIYDKSEKTIKLVTSDGTEIDSEF